MGQDGLHLHCCCAKISADGGKIKYKNGKHVHNKAHMWCLEEKAPRCP